MNPKIREVLEFYACRNNYVDIPEGEDITEMEFDMGEQAREALAALDDGELGRLRAENETLRAEVKSWKILAKKTNQREETLRDWQRRAKRKLEECDSVIQDLGEGLVRRDEALLQLIAEAGQTEVSG